MNWIDYLHDRALLLALGSTRLAGAFLITPMFAPDMIPPLVRNAILVGLAVLLLAVQPQINEPAAATTLHWGLLFAKEAFIGLVIGLFFSTMLWAFQVAGEIIDAKTGATIAQIIDPLTGGPTSLTGSFLAQLANYVFMASGGFFLFVGALMESYVFWPATALAPRIEEFGVRLFEFEFARLMALGLVLCAPALVVLFLVDLTLGLINRFAQQLNVFALSLSIKAWVATAIVALTLGSATAALLREIAERPAAARAVLDRVLSQPQ